MINNKLFKLQCNFKVGSINSALRWIYNRPWPSLYYSQTNTTPKSFTNVYLFFVWEYSNGLSCSQMNNWTTKQDIRSASFSWQYSYTKTYAKYFCYFYIICVRKIIILFLYKQVVEHFKFVLYKIHCWRTFQSSV